MIDPRYTQRLYEALVDLVNTTDWEDVQEVGGEPLQDAWLAARELLDEIGIQPSLRVVLSEALEFVAPCQSEEGQRLAERLANLLNSLPKTL